jgi:hypothetical protein
VADRLVAPGGGAPVLAQHAHVRRAAEVAGQHVGARQEDDALGAGDADEAQPLLLGLLGGLAGALLEEEPVAGYEEGFGEGFGGGFWEGLREGLEEGAGLGFGEK